MTGDRLQRTALLLLITATSMFLLERLFVVVSFFATPLLLFGLAWLISLTLQPLVHDLIHLPLPQFGKRTLRAGVATPTWTMPRTMAVTLVYSALLALITILIFLLVPAIEPQLAGLGTSMPTAVETIAVWLTRIEDELQRVGVRGDLQSIVQPEALAQQVTNFGSTAIQQSLEIAGSIAVLLFDVIVVLFLSFYMTLDGPRLADRLLEILPKSWHSETLTFFSIVNQTFGGFLRAQLLQSLLYGAATGIVMGVLGLSDISLASVLSAILIMIPLVGGLFAIIPPLLVVLIESPDRFLTTLVALMIVQQVLFNLVMPRLLGRVVGLHPLLVFAALLVGGAVAGGWGALFGIPVAGVIASVSHFIYLRATRMATDEQAAG